MSTTTENTIDLIVKRIKKKRRELGYSCENMAFELEISTPAYNKFENGKTRIYLKRLLQICEILKTDLAELISGTPSTNNQQGNKDKQLEESLELYKQNAYLSRKLISNLENMLLKKKVG